jgi:hypothetical protein
MRFSGFQDAPSIENHSRYGSIKRTHPESHSSSASSSQVIESKVDSPNDDPDHPCSARLRLCEVHRALLLGYEAGWVGIASQILVGFNINTHVGSGKGA